MGVGTDATTPTASQHLGHPGMWPRARLRCPASDKDSGSGEHGTKAIRSGHHVIEIGTEVEVATGLTKAGEVES